MSYQNVIVPTGGTKITIKDGRLQVPDKRSSRSSRAMGPGRDIWARLRPRLRRRGPKGPTAENA